MIPGFLCFGWSGDEVEIESGAFSFVENVGKVFLPHFGVIIELLRENFGPLAQRATGAGAFADFGEPGLIGRHDSDREKR